jgi:hypothetical protein
MTKKKKDPRGRKELPKGEKKVFIRIGVKAKLRTEVEPLLIQIANQYNNAK